MKKIFIAMTVVMSCIMLSCSRHSSLEIDIPELNSGKVYVVFADPDQINSRQQENLAEADIKQGSLVLDLDSIRFDSKYKDCTISIISDERQFRCNLPLPLEKGKTIKLTITGIKEYLESKEALRVSYSGSKQAEVFSEYWKQVNDSFIELAKGEDYNKICDKWVKLNKDFLKQYPQSAFPYTIIISQIGNIPNLDNPLLKYCEELSTQESKNKWHNYLVEAYKERVRKEVIAKKMVFAAKDMEGRDFSERNFANKLTLLHFWAVQSPKCVDALAKIDAMNKKYGDKGLQIVNISIDPMPNAWIEWSKNNNLPQYNLFADGAIITQRYNFNNIPFYMLFDKQGNLIAKDNVLESLEQNIVSNLDKQE